MSNPAIIVVTYNRAKSLLRLLQSISSAHYTNSNINLIISIDFSDDNEVLTIANNFVWNYGEKKIIKHQQHLGLKQHILLCGDLTSLYESVIILEDDLLVSPYFYEFAKNALEFYSNDEKIAGISLYNYQVSESSYYPFSAIDDGSDVYFMQIASSWGQLFTEQQWAQFKKWFSINPELPDNNSIPSYIKKWGKHSWKKHYIHYLISENKYFVFPNLSLSTNFEEEGTNSSTKNIFHVPLQVSKKEFVFQHFIQSKSIYDAWFELLPEVLNQLNSIFSEYDYEIDLYQTKNTYSKKYLLTSKVSKNKIISYSFDLFPLETNAILKADGNDICLFKTENNNFTQRKLNLKNYLEDIRPGNCISISIVIPIKNFNYELLKLTLDSILIQNFNSFEIILAIDSSFLNKIEETISYYDFNFQIISYSTTDHEKLIIHGLKQAKNEIVCWINSGNILHQNAFKNVNTIFKSYSSVNWISGINSEPSNKTDYDNIDVFNYRITPGELHYRIKKHAISYSTENNFFRINCLKNQELKELDLKKLYFFLLNNFQLIVLVKRLISKNDTPGLLLNSNDINLIINKYKPKNSLSQKKAMLFNFLFSWPIIGHESYKWYYTSVNNFPDVLRYDFENDTFYFAKY